jgi:hypothetical protein
MNTLKSKWINASLSTKILIVFFVVTVIGFLIMSKKISNLREENEIQKVQLMIGNDSIKQYKTKSGEWYGKFNSVDVENGSLKKSLGELGLTVEKLKSENISYRDVISALNMKLTAKGHDSIRIKDSIRYVDRIKITEHTFNWTNGYLKEWGTLTDKIIDRYYVYSIDLNAVSTQKRKVITVTTSVNDPNARITNGSQINVVYKAPWYEKGWIWGAAGFVAGIIVNK